MSILSDHLLLGEARERYPCVGAPTWIRGERQLLDTTEKIRLSRVSCIYIQAINLFHCDPYFPLLVCLTRTIAC